MNKKCFILTTAASLFSLSAFAGGYPATDSVPVVAASIFPVNVFYLSLNGGQTVIGNITRNSRQHTGFQDFAVAAYGGFQYDTTWAAELGVAYHSMGSFGNFEIFDIAAKASVPMSAHSVVFLKLGGAAYTLRACDGGCATETKGAPFFGAGFGLQFSPVLRATIEYDGVYATSGMADGSLGALTGGLTYYFI